MTAPTPLEVARMSHRDDPDTSHAAAVRARRGRKVVMIQGAIVAILTMFGPLTAKEIFAEYVEGRTDISGWLPAADLQDIRRRLTELQHDVGSVVDTGTRRNGERVMGIAPASEVAA